MPSVNIRRRELKAVNSLSGNIEDSNHDKLLFSMTKDWWTSECYAKLPLRFREYKTPGTAYFADAAQRKFPKSVH